VSALSAFLWNSPVSFASGASHFVQVRGTRFEINGKPCRFMGANYWQGASLGSPGRGGDRARLLRELDQMKALGVTNLRVLAASQGPDSQPLRIVPSTQPSPDRLDSELLQGLDFLLDEMRKRDMRAVVVLNNFWHWSGGMAQFLNWAGAGSIPYPPPFPGGTWDRYQDYTQRFYANPRAVQLSNDLIRAILTRTSSVSGTRYVDDPTVMSWQLANEPRGLQQAEAFNRWIEATSRMIRGLAPRQLISTGVEGETPWPAYAGMDLIRNHAYSTIDYATIHIWAQNWGWYDPSRHASTYNDTLTRFRAYVADHVRKSAQLGKPLVLEEFGIGRDQGSYDPASLTRVRDQYYREAFELVLTEASRGSPLQGVNFWAWGGEGRPKTPYGSEWRAGDPWTGDPPHELQGWYSVYSSDTSTHGVIAEYARRLMALP
jgi:mannan endo-1,4-beta-mannosidase